MRSQNDPNFDPDHKSKGNSHTKGISRLFAIYCSYICETRKSFIAIAQKLVTNPLRSNATDRRERPCTPRVFLQEFRDVKFLLTRNRQRDWRGFCSVLRQEEGTNGC
jgi:hypothetical protein